MTSFALADRSGGRGTVLGFTLAGARDILDGCRQWRLWYLMGSSEMRRRYARSRLGQVWIMVSSAVMISTIGLVWSHLWQQPVQDMLPHVAVGLVTWQLLSGILGEATAILPGSTHYFLNQYIAASTILLSMLYRHIITFLLNLVFPLALSFALGSPLSIAVLLFIPGLVLLLIGCFWMGFVIAILCTRFRDVVQLVSSFLYVALFLTPILWKPEMLPQEAQSYLVWNPLAVLISVVRDPLLDRPVPSGDWAIAIGISAGGLVLTLPLIGRFRRRLVYWL